MHTKTPGGQSVLSADEASTYKFPLDSLDLRKIVKGYLDRKGVIIRNFTNDLPGAKWVRLFLKRHAALIQRLAANIKSVRAVISPDIVNKYFDNLERQREFPQ